MPFVSTTNCAALHYVDTGSGRPLIFIHGWSFSGAVWQCQLPYFQDSFRCIVLDLPGHGQSSPSLTGYGLDASVTALTDLCVTLDVRDAVLVGWSLGALIALAALSVLQGRVAAVALIAGTSKFTNVEGYCCGLDAKEVRGMSLRLRRNPAATFEDFSRLMFTPGDLLAGVPSGRYDSLTAGCVPLSEASQRSLETLADADVRHVLSGLRLPVLVLHGEDDPICPVAGARYMAEQLPNAQLQILAGSGHAPFIAFPRECAGILQEFIGRFHEED